MQPINLDCIKCPSKILLTIARKLLFFLFSNGVPSQYCYIAKHYSVCFSFMFIFASSKTKIGKATSVCVMHVGYMARRILRRFIFGWISWAVDYKIYLLTFSIVPYMGHAAVTVLTARTIGDGINLMGWRKGNRLRDSHWSVFAFFFFNTIEAQCRKIYAKNVHNHA